jgi:hypothetical protein
MNPLLMNNKSFSQLSNNFQYSTLLGLILRLGFRNLMNYKRERWQVAFLILTAEHLKYLKAKCIVFHPTKFSKTPSFLITN